MEDTLAAAAWPLPVGDGGVGAGGACRSLRSGTLSLSFRDWGGRRRVPLRAMVGTGPGGSVWGESHSCFSHYSLETFDTARHCTTSFID